MSKIIKQRTCTITITPDNPTQANVETGEVSAIEILEALKTLSKHFAQVLVEEARKHVGDDPAAQEKWLDSMRQNPKNN